MGKREMGAHTIPKVFRFVNFFMMNTYTMAGASRQVLSRFIGSTNGPLNYTGMFGWMIMTGIILARFRFDRSRDIFQFNTQDQPEFWYNRYQMIFPASFLHNRLSAHFIEINHIFTVEMFKKYRAVRQEVILDREQASQKDRLTKYITNSNYIYEPMGEDSPLLVSYRLSGKF